MAATDNLFVSGLPGTVDDATLKQLFSQYGDVAQCRVLQGRFAGADKVSALVRYATVDEATWVVENVNNNVIHGLSEPVQIKFSEPPGAVGKGGAGAGAAWGKGAAPYAAPGAGAWAKGGGVMMGGKGKGKAGIKEIVTGIEASGALPGGTTFANDDKTIFIRHLPPDTDDVWLYRIFSPFGALAPKGVTAMKDRETGECKGIGFINFLESSAAQAAIATLDGAQISDGTTLRLSIKNEGGGKGKGKGKDGAVPAA